ncbi:MAG: type II toxin-antitoxin system VapC family toxin [Gemmatimonadales bacterium]
MLCDVNVLVYAFRRDAARHDDYHDWLRSRLGSDEGFGTSDLVLSGFVRVVTHPRVFLEPSTPSDAFRFADALRAQPNAVPVGPGPRHWEIFRRLCHTAAAKGNLIPDAYFAALAVESGCEWITTDRDYARFPGLRWRHPLANP